MIQHGDEVNFKLLARLKDGEEFNLGNPEGHLSMIAGEAIEDDLVGSTVSQSLLGMRLTEEKEFFINNAFGDYIDDLVQETPVDSLPPQTQVGDILTSAENEEEESEFPQTVYVKDIMENGMAIIDFNHPLAGKDVTFKVTILDIQSSEGQMIPRTLS